VLDSLGAPADAAALRARLLDFAGQALQAEHEHLIRMAENLSEHSEETFKEQLNERFDALDAYVEGGNIEPEEGEETQAPRRPLEVLQELSSLVKTPLRLSTEQLRALSADPHEVVEDVRSQVRSYLMGMSINRLVNTFERRLEDELNIKANQVQMLPWKEVEAEFLNAVEEALNLREERLLGEQGLIAHDIDAEGQRLERAVTDLAERTRLLGIMSQGTRLVFDPKTHRKAMQVTTRLRYAYLSARLLGEKPPQWITDDVLDHLAGAQEMMIQLWGQSEWNRIDHNVLSLKNLDERVQARLAEELGTEYIQSILDVPLKLLSAEDRSVVVTAMGRHIQNEVYRQILLGAISELWVDYLTRVEGLRVSIGLEAYAQRDPLVQYKGKASELFTQLLRDIRSGVLGRMFVFRPSQVGPATTEGPRMEATHPVPEAPTPAPRANPQPGKSLPGKSISGNGGPGKAAPVKPGPGRDLTARFKPEPQAGGGAKKKRKRH
jgi:preprotein translocase subunit SecA